MDSVKIRLRKPRRVLSFLCDGLALQRGDACIVESEHGLEWGVCILPPEPCPSEIAERIKARVLRKVTDEDEESFHRIAEEEAHAGQLCRKRIEKRGLPMQLVDVEYTFDRHKVTFFFTAENRVDFRELVRDLARELHSRIELRHIQVRDRSKLVGGLGCCGRTLCCNSFLEEFVPISMRMAKCQNLSLNPGKISGQCGRLLCCLNYESEAYERGEVRASKAVAPDAESVDEAQLAAIEDEAKSRSRARAIVVEAPESGPSEDGDVSRGSAPQGQNKPGKRRKNRKKKRNPSANRGGGA